MTTNLWPLNLRLERGHSPIFIMVMPGHLGITALWLWPWTARAGFAGTDCSLCRLEGRSHRHEPHAGPQLPVRQIPKVGWVGPRGQHHQNLLRDRFEVGTEVDGGFQRQDLLRRRLVG